MNTHNLLIDGVNQSCHVHCCPNPGNCTSEVIESQPWLQMWPYICYTIQGIFFGIANLLIFVAILKHPLLRCRKEYVIVAALAFADVIHDTCMTYAGIFKTLLLQENKGTECKYPFECLTTVEFIANISIPLVYFMVLCISIDRFMFVLRPLLYKTLSINYSLLIAAFFYIIAIVEATLRMLSALNNTKYANHCPQVPSLCTLDEVLGGPSFYISVSVHLCCSMASVLLYAAIPFIYKRQVRRLTNLGEYGKAELNFLQEQRKLLVTLGICSIFTFLIMTCPTIIRLVLYSIPDREAIPWAVLILDFNPVVNTFPFMFRHRKFRESLISVLKCKSVKIEENDSDRNVFAINVN